MQGSENRQRLLAPTALAVFGLIFFAILLTSGGGDQPTRPQPNKEGGSSSGSARKSDQRSGTSTQTTTTPAERVYVVKAGDSLATISEATGVSIQKLEELNPDLDPRALVTGQKIKLR